MQLNLAIVRAVPFLGINPSLPVYMRYVDHVDCNHFFFFLITENKSPRGFLGSFPALTHLAAPSLIFVFSLGFFPLPPLYELFPTGAC